MKYLRNLFYLIGGITLLGTFLNAPSVLNSDNMINILLWGVSVIVAITFLCIGTKLKELLPTKARLLQIFVTIVFLGQIVNTILFIVRSSGETISGIYLFLPFIYLFLIVHFWRTIGKEAKAL